AGPEIHGQLMLRVGFGQRAFVSHVQTGVNPLNARKGQLNRRNVAALSGVWWRLVRTIGSDSPDVMYVHLSQNWTGLMRDAVLILTARLRGVRVVVHVHGSNFGPFYRRVSRQERALIRGLLRCVDTVIVLGERFCEQFGPPVFRGRVAVLRNPVD